mgnify:CR=1 FL=1
MEIEILTVQISISRADWDRAFSYVDGRSAALEHYIDNDLVQWSRDGLSHEVDCGALNDTLTEEIPGWWVAATIVERANQDLMKIAAEGDAEDAYYDSLERKQSNWGHNG